MRFRDAMWSIVGYIVATQGVVPFEERNNYLQIDDYKENILQMLGHILSQAAEKIDSPDSNKQNNQEKDNKYIEESSDDDEDGNNYKKDW